MRRGSVVISVLLAVLTLSSCAKVKVNTDYTVRLWTETRADSKSNERRELENGSVWVAYVDPNEWMIADYADVNRPGEAPLATSKRDGGKRPFDAEMDNLWLGAYGYKITKKPVMLLMFDKDQPMFAYGDGNVTDNLSELTVSIQFQPWMSESEYFYGKRWNIVYEDTTVDVDCTYIINPREVLETGGTGQRIDGMKVYALAADSAEWFVHSIEDARDGVLSRKEDSDIKRSFGGDDLLVTISETVTNATFELTGTNRKVMFVLADATEDMYAYAGADLYKNPVGQNETINFPVYEGTYDSEKDENHKTRWVIKLDGVTVPQPEP